MLDYLDEGLFKNGLVDSLSIVALIAEVETNIGCKIVIKRMKPEDFSTVHNLAAAIDHQLFEVSEPAS